MDQVILLIFLSDQKFNLVKYGTLTCADGFIKVDIYSKDVMLAVCFAIFILQGNNNIIRFQINK